VTAVSKQEPLLLDAVFDCCGQLEALAQAVEMLKPGGKLMIIGIPEIERVSFVIDQLRRKELCVQNVRRQCECVEPTLEMMGERKISGDFMVTHRFPFEETKEAFDLVAAYGDGVVKAMIRVTP
jgi:threonine dehydrogenase-like Zn-dependent dehydrogenase